MDLPDRWQDRIIIVQCPVCWAGTRERCRKMRRNKAGHMAATRHTMTGFHFARRVRAMRLGAPKPRGRNRSVIPVIKLKSADPPPPRRKRKPRNRWGL